MKGIMIMFDGGYYEYPPLNLNKKEFEQWYDNLMDNTDKMWIKNIYWRLEDYSNVLVVRNRKWYASVLPSFIKIWNTILQERKTGYEHRRPNKRGKKVKKINNKSETDIKNLFPNLPDSPKMNKGNIIINGRKSNNSLYSEDLVTFEEGKTHYNHKDAEGFIKLNALRLKILQMKHKN